MHKATRVIARAVSGINRRFSEWVANMGKDGAMIVYVGHPDFPQPVRIGAINLPLFPTDAHFEEVRMLPFPNIAYENGDTIGDLYERLCEEIKRCSTYRWEQAERGYCVEQGIRHAIVFSNDLTNDQKSELRSFIIAYNNMEDVR